MVVRNFVDIEASATDDHVHSTTHYILDDNQCGILVAGGFETVTNNGRGAFVE